MKNIGLFSSLFIDSLKKQVEIDDAAKGRLSTLIHSWKSCDKTSQDTLWNTFLKQALSYLEFVPPISVETQGVYKLYEDWGYENCVSILYLVPPDDDISNTEVGRFYPAKLIAELKKLDLTWGILTDGSNWRLYSTKSSRPYEDFVELLLEHALMESDESEYGLFERFFHLDSFIDKSEDNEKAEDSPVIRKCRLDTDREQSEQILEEMVKTPFLTQVDEVLQYICNGFILDTQKASEEYVEEERREIFDSAVKLIYRCLFLFYAEARKMLPSDKEKTILYERHSMHALCLEARKFRWGLRHQTSDYDLWKHLKALITAVNTGDPEYGIMGYNGGLFDDEEELFLGQHQLRNDFLSRALYLLAFVDPISSDPVDEYEIPYEDLEVRHLGELYENILEYTVQLADADRIRRRSNKGVEFLLANQTDRRTGDVFIKKGDIYFGESALERKQTGSYYTPESLVKFLNENTIVEPLLEKFNSDYRTRFEEFISQAKSGHDQGIRRGAAQSAASLVERYVDEEVLNFTVCDPAMGSGHFLVNATNQMSAMVVSLLEEIPYVEGMTSSVTSMPNEWRRLITRHCIYGVDLNPLAVNLAKLSLWLNSFANQHKLTFLDHHLRYGNSLIGIRSLSQLAVIPKRKKDKKKDERQGLLFDFDNLSKSLTQAAEDIFSITLLDEDDTDTQKSVLDDVQKNLAWHKPLADLYTAYLMDSGMTSDEYAETFERLARGESLEGSLNPKLIDIWEKVRTFTGSHDYFHWPLEFPELFVQKETSGFSATVGNPPWDIVKPNSQEFFSAYDPKFRSYKKQEANRVSNELMLSNPLIGKKWKEYSDNFVQQSNYFREVITYKYLGKGDINTFKLFLERFFIALNSIGQMGIIVPSGIYTDQGCQPLRELFFSKSTIKFLYGFENRWPTVFPAVDGRFKFVAFSTRKGKPTDKFKCAFMEHDPERLPIIHTKALEMTIDQVKEFSPNTLSVMELNSISQIDALLKMHRGKMRIKDVRVENWPVRFASELHMTGDSSLFLNDPTNWPLYEGKMIWHFDHKFSPPRYWLDEVETMESIGENGRRATTYRLLFRDVAASTNERTFITTIAPPCFFGHTIASIAPPDNVENYYFEIICSLTALFNSYCCDFVMRLKVTNHMSFHYLSQLPIPHWGSHNRSLYDAIVSRAVRLIACDETFSNLWETVFKKEWKLPTFWYPPFAHIDNYGPDHEQKIRKRIRIEVSNLTEEWGPHCGTNDRLPDRRDIGDRAQLRAEIDAYVAHLYGLSREDFTYILDTFPVLKKKEEKVFGEFKSKRKCLEEYDRIKLILEHEES